MRVITGIRRSAALAIAAGIAIAGLGMATSAEAATSYKGKVTANGGLNIRPAPSTHSGIAGSVAKGKTITIDCKVPGTTVGGNRLWYALSGKKGWVSARYVDNIGAAPKLCPAFDTEFGVGRTTAVLNQRSGPHFNDSLRGALPKGKKVQVRCYVKSSAGVDNNFTWYLLDNNNWVSAYYVKRLSVPASNWVPCAE